MNVNSVLVRKLNEGRHACVLFLIFIDVVSQKVKKEDMCFSGNAKTKTMSEFGCTSCGIGEKGAHEFNFKRVYER